MELTQHGSECTVEEDALAFLTDKKKLHQPRLMEFFYFIIV